MDGCKLRNAKLHCPLLLCHTLLPPASIESVSAVGDEHALYSGDPSLS